MLTVTTCPSSTLEKLCRELRDPKTFEESVMLKGVETELRSRRGPLQVDLENALEEAARRPIRTP